jgi:hypothetical protein
LLLLHLVLRTLRTGIGSSLLLCLFGDVLKLLLRLWWLGLLILLVTVRLLLWRRSRRLIGELGWRVQSLSRSLPCTVLSCRLWWNWRLHLLIHTVLVMTLSEITARISVVLRILLESSLLLLGWCQRHLVYCLQGSRYLLIGIILVVQQVT